jgi:hypothetical protein
VALRKEMEGKKMIQAFMRENGSRTRDMVKGG